MVIFARWNNETNSLQQAAMNMSRKHGARGSFQLVIYAHFLREIRETAVFRESYARPRQWFPPESSLDYNFIPGPESRRVELWV